MSDVKYIIVAHNGSNVNVYQALNNKEALKFIQDNGGFETEPDEITVPLIEGAKFLWDTPGTKYKVEKIHNLYDSYPEVTIRQLSE